jgi:hypothetical protein
MTERIVSEQDPTKVLFWRALLETPEATARKMADPSAEL